jgi:tetratricopeptide (TPR) repeat protein
VTGDGSWMEEGGYPYPKGITYVGDLYPINYYQSLTSLSLSRELQQTVASRNRLLVMADPIYDDSDPRLQGREQAARRTDRESDAALTDRGRSQSTDAVESSSGKPLHQTGDVTVSRALSDKGQVSTHKADPNEATMAPRRGTVRRKVEVTGKAQQQTPEDIVRVVDRAHQAGSVPHDSQDSAQLSWPRLELTGKLGTAIEKMSPDRTDLFVGKEADKSVLFKIPLHRYSAIVFGTHGYFGQDIPGVMEPILVMNMVPQGEKGYLRMSEVMDLDLNADIVALTACKTGLGEYLLGEGIMSMGRAFQYAGAKSVLMSLWTVPEEASVTLVQAFMKHLNNGKSKADALSMARTEVRRLKKHYNHPFYWASFVLVGEADQPTAGRAAGWFNKSASRKDMKKRNDSLALLVKAKDLQSNPRSRGDLEKARREYESALRSFERDNSEKGIGLALSALGEFHAGLGQYSKASNYLSRYVRLTLNSGNLRKEGEARVSLGQVYANMSQYGKAVEEFDKALNAFRLVGDVGGESGVLNHLGDSYCEWGKTTKAIEQYEAALSLGTECGDLAEQAVATRNLAAVYVHLDQYQKAFDLYMTCLSYFRQLKDGKDVTRVLREVGHLNREWQKYDGAVQYVQKSIAASKDSGNSEAEADALLCMALVYQDWGKYELAESQLKKSLALFKGLKQPRNEARVMLILGEVYEKWGNPQQAASFYKKALDTVERANLQGIQVDALVHHALNQGLRGEFDNAAKALDSGLKIARQLGDAKREWEIQQSMGSLEESRGLYQEALTRYAGALAIADGLKLNELAATSRLRFAEVLTRLGRYDEAERLLNKTLERSNNLARPKRESKVRERLASLYAHTGRLERAIAELNKVTETYRSLRLAEAEAGVLRTLAKVCADSGRDQEAVEYLNRSLTLFRKLDQVDGEIEVLRDWGAVYQSQGRYDRAIEHLENALALARKSKLVGSEAMLLDLMGQSLGKLGQHNEAIQALNKTVSMKRKLRDVKGEARSLMLLGNVYEQMGRQDRAVSNLHNALKIASKYGLPELEAAAHNNLGRVFTEWSNHNKAIIHLDTAMSLAKQQGYKKSEADIHRNVGALFRELGDLDKSLDHLDKSLAITKSLGDVGESAVTLESIGRTLHAEGKLDEALAAFSESLTNESKSGGSTGETNEFMGLVYLAKGDVASAKKHIVNSAALEPLAMLKLATGEYGEAKRLYEQLLDKASKTRKPRQLFNAYTGLGKAYEGLGDLKNAERSYSKGLREAETVAKNSTKFAPGTSTNGRNLGLDSSEASAGLERVKAKMENRPAKTAAVPAR